MDNQAWAASGGKPVSLAVGFFDGVHLGHQQVIRSAVADARRREAVSVIVTFDRHPSEVVAPERAPLLIYSRSQRLRVLGEMGADAVRVYRFDEAFSLQTGESFLGRMREEFEQLASISVGASFKFGHRRSGDVTMLERMGKADGFAVYGIAAVSLDGQPVSSTRIRETLAAGQLELAGQMLGRPYTLVGEVVRGDGRGRSLGYPTANLDVAGRQTPPTGVYAAHARLEDRVYRAALNIGRRPTVQGSGAALQAEAHLLDFEGELYGRELEMALEAKLREERRFETLEALRGQIGADVAAVRSLFGGGRERR